MSCRARSTAAGDQPGPQPRLLQPGEGAGLSLVPRIFARLARQRCFGGVEGVEGVEGVWGTRVANVEPWLCGAGGS
jgi:hypothetical protein